MRIPCYQAAQVTLAQQPFLQSFSTTNCEANDVNVLEYKIQKGLYLLSLSQQAALKIYNKTWTPVAATQERFYLERFNL